MKKYLILFFLSLGSLCAQTDEPKVSVGLDIVFWGDWPREPVEVRTSTETKTIGLVPYENTQFFVYNGPPQAIFFRRAKSALPNEKPVGTPLFTADIPLGVKRALLVIFVSGSQDANYRTMVIPCDDEGFPPNSLMAWNGMAEPILARLGSASIVLPSAKPHVISVSPSEGTLPVMIAGQFRGQQRLIYSSTIPFAAGGRSLIIFYNSNPGEEGRVDVFTYDLPSTAERQTAADGVKVKAPTWRENLPYKIDYQPPPRPELSIQEYIPEK